MRRVRKYCRHKEGRSKRKKKNIEVDFKRYAPWKLEAKKQAVRLTNWSKRGRAKMPRTLTKPDLKHFTLRFE